MNGYQRPGFPPAAAPDSHVLRAVRNHRQFAAQVLAAEERRHSDLIQHQEWWLLRDARAQDDRVSAWTLLRLIVGSAFIRLGQRLAGAPASASAEATVG
jgi:hypothetical protein